MLSPLRPSSSSSSSSSSTGLQSPGERGGPQAAQIPDDLLHLLPEVEHNDMDQYVWSQSLFEDLGLPLKKKDGKDASLGDEFPMSNQHRVALIKGIPDIRTFRDLGPRDHLPEDPDDTRDLSDGERVWITRIAPALHRQLLQILSVNAFLAQELSANFGAVQDGTFSGLELEDVANLCKTSVVLTMDSIRSIVDSQRSRILKAGGRRQIPSVGEAQRKIISDSMQEALAQQAERELNLKLARPTLISQVSSALKGGTTYQPTRRPRFSRFQDTRGGFGSSQRRYDPEVNSTPSKSYRSSQSWRSTPFQHRGRRGRGRGNTKFSR